MSNVNLGWSPGSVMLHSDTTVTEVIHMKPVRNCVQGKKEFPHRKLDFWQKSKFSILANELKKKGGGNVLFYIT